MRKYIEKFRSRLKGSVLGGVLLISGSCIGIGMLTLPILSGLSGFFPSLLILLIAWIFMLSTALLFSELLLQYPDLLSFTSLAERTLGNFGKLIIRLSFLFLFYSIIIAYLVKGGQLVQEVLDNIIPNLPFWSGAFILSLIVAITIFIGTSFVDKFNRICMVGLFVAYFFLISTGKTNADWKNLTHVDFKFSFLVIPFLMISFGFQNMLPSVKDYLGGNKQKLIKTIIFGSAIPLIVYILWIMHVLSIVPFQGEISIYNSYLKGQISSEPLARLIDNIYLSTTVQFFAFFAIITSLFGQSLSVLDFIADTIHIPRNKLNRALISLAIFIPTFYLSQAYSNIFFRALEFGGGMLTVILFGVMPALMVWNSRYVQKKQLKILPGGKISLVLIILVSSFVFILEFLKQINVL